MMVEKTLLTVLGIALWLPLMVLRVVLMILAAVMVLLSLIAKGQFNTPNIWSWAIGNVKDIPEKAKKNRWTKFVEMAIRNPLTGLDGLIRQPIPEIHPNPDELVRARQMQKARRWMQHGIFWEYWSLSKMKSDKFWEFRIGWKFVDGNNDFVPTFQLGPKE